MTLDEWVEENAPDLQEDIQTHLDALTESTTDEKETIVRMIMISVRQWAEENR